jgi:hypothetical protein
MSLVSWVQMARGRFRQERDRKKSDYLLCSICDNPVRLETSKADEFGKAVHEECYVLKVTGARRRSEPGRTCVRNPREESGFRQGRLIRQGCLICRE